MKPISPFALLVSLSLLALPSSATAANLSVLSATTVAADTISPLDMSSDGTLLIAAIHNGPIAGSASNQVGVRRYDFIYWRPSGALVQFPFSLSGNSDDRSTPESNTLGGVQLTNRGDIFLSYTTAPGQSSSGGHFIFVAADGSVRNLDDALAGLNRPISSPNDDGFVAFAQNGRPESVAGVFNLFSGESTVLERLDNSVGAPSSFGLLSVNNNLELAGGRDVKQSDVTAFVLNKTATGYSEDLPYNPETFGVGRFTKVTAFGVGPVVGGVEKLSGDFQQPFLFDRVTKIVRTFAPGRIAAPLAVTASGRSLVTLRVLTDINTVEPSSYLVSMLSRPTDVDTKIDPPFVVPQYYGLLSDQCHVAGQLRQSDGGGSQQFAFDKIFRADLGANILNPQVTYGGACSRSAPPPPLHGGAANQCDLTFELERCDARVLNKKTQIYVEVQTNHAGKWRRVASKAISAWSTGGHKVSFRLPKHVAGSLSLRILVSQDRKAAAEVVEGPVDLAN